MLLGFRLRKIKEIFHFTLTLVRTVMDGHGRSWTVMDAWALMDAHGRLRTLMDAWTLMDDRGRSWTIVDDHGRSRTFSDACEILSRDGHVHASKS